jgi:hypothetical protein
MKVFSMIQQIGLEALRFQMTVLSLTFRGDSMDLSRYVEVKQILKFRCTIRYGNELFEARG